MPFVPDHIRDGLTGIREGLRLQWNPKAVLLQAGSYDSTGKLRDPEYDPRWELWDTDPDGRDYMVMRLQNVDGSFRPYGEWLIEHINKLNPAHYGGSVEKMMAALVEEPELLREIGTEEDSDDLIEAVANWAAWCETPKSAAGLTHRGKKLQSA